MPSNTVLICGPAVLASQILISSYSCVLLPPMSTAIRTPVFSFVGTFSVLSYTPQTDSLLSWWYGFNLQLVQLVGRFWVFFLSHTGPGFQLWFYFHLCMWVVHWGLLSRVPYRTWVCPCEGQMWRWCSCLGCRDSGNTRYSEELVARAAGNIVLYIIYIVLTIYLEGCGNQYWPTRSSILAWRPALTEKPGRSQTIGSERAGHYQNDLVRTDARFFFPVAALPQWELSVKVA